MASVDLAKRRRQRERAAPNFARYDFLYQLAVDDLSERLANFNRDFASILVVGDHIGRLSDLCQLLYPEALVVATDLSLGFIKQGKGMRIVCRDDMVPLAHGKWDLILSPLVLHLTENIPDTISGWYDLLSDSGVMLANCAGKQSLRELKRVLMQSEIGLKRPVVSHVLPLPDARQVATYLQQSKYQLPVVDNEVFRINYADILGLMYDLRGMGQGGVTLQLRPGYLTKEVLQVADRLYHEVYPSKDGSNIVATIEIISIMGTK